MASLSNTLSIASQALMVQEAEISVTNNNIANKNVAGYTRESAVVTEAQPIEVGSVSMGDGVELEGVQSLREELLTNQIQQQTSQQGSLSAQASALNDVQTLLPTSGTNLSTSLSKFFTSISALSTSPDSSTARSAVLSTAQTLVSQFNSVSAGMTSTQGSLDTQVTTDVNQINSLSQQAAALNSEIAQQPATVQGGGALTDQLNQVELSLSGLTNISVTHTAHGDTITTGNGSPLVVGGQSYALSTGAGADGHQQVMDSNGTNITTNISGGDLGGTIQVRDKTIPSMLNQLDTMANAFGTAFNAAQAKGFDQNGNAGGNLFTVPTTVAGSAAGISLATTDPTAIAASSSTTSPASDGNLANLVAVQNTSVPPGSSVNTMSANLVYQVGEATSTATAEQTAVGQSLTSLTTQQSSVSGVSIDEESANLLRYQQAYQASAQVISTVNTLMTATINMMTAA